MGHLPTDVLVLICEELGYRHDFQTLFHCALAGKVIVKPALDWLYRIYSYSTFNSSEGSDVENGKLTQAQILQKWALQWKTIIRSSLGKTAYPYCLYIRSLDLRNLGELLDDPLFRDYAMDLFFADEMVEFLKVQKSQTVFRSKPGKSSNMRIDIIKVVELVGKSIITFVFRTATQARSEVAVEDITGNIQSEALLSWTIKLPNLKSMTLWDGSSLNQDVATAISKNCYEFGDLTFYTLSSFHADRELASFFNGLRPNTLQSFAALSAYSIGTKTLRSLRNHAESLRCLKLDGLRSEAVRKLSLLQDCKAITSLEIADSDGLIDLYESNNDVYQDIIKWLQGCSELHELRLRNLVSAPDIVSAICMYKFVRLKKLQVLWYPLPHNKFYRAVSGQTSLESLELDADADGATADDINSMVYYVTHLTNLKYLNLLSTSDCFSTAAIVRLALSLPELEELTFGGYNVSDDLWDSLANLRFLRVLNVHAVSSFSFEGILAYVDALHDTNEGLYLSVMSQRPDFPISEGEQIIIRQSLTANVNGTFDFTHIREPESDTDSSF